MQLILLICNFNHNNFYDLFVSERGAVVGYKCEDKGLLIDYILIPCLSTVTRTYRNVVSNSSNSIVKTSYEGLLQLKINRRTNHLNSNV